MISNGNSCRLLLSESPSCRVSPHSVERLCATDPRKLEIQSPCSFVLLFFLLSFRELSRGVAVGGLCTDIGIDPHLVSSLFVTCSFFFFLFVVTPLIDSLSGLVSVRRRTALGGEPTGERAAARPIARHPRGAHQVQGPIGQRLPSGTPPPTPSTPPFGLFPSAGRLPVGPAVRWLFT